MPKWIPHTCRICGVERSEFQHISRRGLCPRCAIGNITEAVRNAQTTGSVGAKMTNAKRWGDKGASTSRGVGDQSPGGAGESAAFARHPSAGSK